MAEEPSRYAGPAGCPNAGADHRRFYAEPERNAIVVLLGIVVASPEGSKA